MTRAENEQWLRDGVKRNPEGWEARLVRRFTLPGVLSMFDATEGNLNTIDLRRKPFHSDPELRELVRRARQAQHELVSTLNRKMWEVS